MPQSPEVASIWRFIDRSLERLVTSLDGLSEEDLNWRPAAAETNSLQVLAVHTLGNVEESVLEILCGQPVGRDRDAEFAAEAAAGPGGHPVRERWLALQRRAQACLADLPAGALDGEYTHPRRGTISGRDVLLIAATHAAEHAGQAELTRDLLRAARG